MIDNLLHLLTYNPDETMVFSSGLFLMLFLILSFVYMLTGHSTTNRLVFVTLFSSYFYYKCSGTAVVVLWVITLSDYLIARGIGAFRKPFLQRLLLGLSIFIDIGLLAFFKMSAILSEYLHIGSIDSLIVPIGISFYTFRSLSYTVDVYRGKMTATTSLLDYAFFTTFFPVLLAGPINRAIEFLPQIHRKLCITPMMLAQGAFLIAVGLLKKIVVSDFISLNFVDRVFDNPTLFSGGEVLLAIYGYCIQIYCDFSGYSDIAIGIALWMGFRLEDNFRQPFLADSFSDFWHRWHITLSQWIRDYIYIPLGGNRCSALRVFLNQMVTMLLCGLWHGVSWTFMLWGGIHGLLLCIHKFFSHKVLNHDRHYHPHGWRRVAAIFITFHILCFSWLPFRLSDLSQVQVMLHQLLTKFNVAVMPDVLLAYRWVFLTMLMAFVAHFIPYRWENILVRKIAKGGILASAFLLVIVIYIVIQVQSSGVQPFIYFQF